MPERLTECLTRRGLLDPARGQEAIERQVLLGGALDTCLLEMRLVPEPALLDAMAAAYGLATATPAEVTCPLDTLASRAFPEQWAKKHCLAPLTLDADRYVLTVLSPAPPDVNLLVRLGELLELTIRPLLTAEYRVHQRLSLLYDEKPPERFRALIEQVADQASLSPRAMASELSSPRIIARPLTFGEAVTRLKEARDRDEIVHTALAYAHRDLDYAAMFIVHDGRLDGWAAAGGGSADVAQASLSLKVESAFKVVLDTHAHYLGPLPSDPTHNDLLASIGRVHPRAALIVPIRIKGRTIALMYGENGPRTIAPRLAADLMLFTTHVQGALEGLLVRKKVASLSELQRAGDSQVPAPQLEVLSSQPDTPRSELEIPPPVIEHSTESALEEVIELAEVVLESEPAMQAIGEHDTPLVVREVDEDTDRLAARGLTPRRTGYKIIKGEDSEDLDGGLANLVETTGPLIPAPITPREGLLARITSGGYAAASPLPREATPVSRSQDIVPPAAFLPKFQAPEEHFEPTFEPPVESDDLPELHLAPPEPDTDALAVAYTPQSDDWSPVQVDQEAVRAEVDEVPPEATNAFASAVLAEGSDGALIDELDQIPIDEEPSDEEPSDDVDAPEEIHVEEPEPEPEPPGLVAPNLPDSTTPMAMITNGLVARDHGIVLDMKTAIEALPANTSSPDNADSWDAVSVETWDEGAQKAQREMRASLVEDSTLPDLSAEAWIRASSDLVKPRPLPPEVMERAAMEVAEDPVPLTRTRPIVDAEAAEAAADAQAAVAPADDEPVPLTRMTSQIVRPRSLIALPTQQPEPARTERDVPEHRRDALLRPPTPAFPTPAVQPRLPSGIRSQPPAPAAQVQEQAPLPGKLVAPELATDPKIARAAQVEAEINGLLARLETYEPTARRQAREALIAMGPYVIPKLMERFPGQVALDPFAPSATTLPPFVDCGELLAILAAFGVDAHPYVVRRLDAPDALQRFFATYFYAAVYAPDAIPRLVQRLHDEEPRVCMLAARTLFAYRELPEFASVLEHLHGRLDATSLTARKHAAYLIGLFRDVSAVPLLIGLFDKKDKAMFDAAEGALAEITKQRIGPNAKKWRSWWSKNQARSRIGWLVDGLGSKEASMRRSSAEELRAVTGVDFGYDEDAPRKHREDARQRWVKWWNDQYALHKGRPDGDPAST